MESEDPRVVRDYMTSHTGMWEGLYGNSARVWISPLDLWQRVKMEASKGGDQNAGWMECVDLFPTDCDWEFGWEREQLLHAALELHDPAFFARVLGQATPRDGRRASRRQVYTYWHSDPCVLEDGERTLCLLDLNELDENDRGCSEICPALASWSRGKFDDAEDTARARAMLRTIKDTILRLWPTKGYEHIKVTKEKAWEMGCEECANGCVSGKYEAYRMLCEELGRQPELSAAKLSHLIRSAAIEDRAEPKWHKEVLRVDRDRLGSMLTKRGSGPSGRKRLQRFKGAAHKYLESVIKGDRDD